MTKAELINRVADATGLPKVATESALNGLGDVAAAELRQGGELPIPGLGKLVVKMRKAREGRNPQTGAAIHIPAKKAVAFKVSKGLTQIL